MESRVASAAPLPAVENIMANYGTVPATSGDKKKQLSAEAKTVVDNLPLLTFMQATVLMFPLKEDTWLPPLHVSVHLVWIIVMRNRPGNS